MQKTAFIEYNIVGWPLDTDMMAAAEGFENLGYRLKSYTRQDVLQQKYRPQFVRDNFFVGGYTTMQLLLQQANALPLPIDYPSTIQQSGLLNRRVATTTLGQALSQATGGQQDCPSNEWQPIFIKPVKTKLFTGRKLTRPADLAYFDDFPLDTPVHVADILDIVSEWRCFVLFDQLLDGRPYAGSFREPPDWHFVEQNITTYAADITRPSAYTLDVAVVKTGQTVVIEYNYFYSISHYGLAQDTYAEMLRTRYAEIVANSFPNN